MHYSSKEEWPKGDTEIIRVATPPLISKHGATFLVSKRQTEYTWNLKGMAYRALGGRNAVKEDYWAKEDYSQGVRYNRVRLARSETCLGPAIPFLFLPFEMECLPFGMWMSILCLFHHYTLETQNSSVLQVHNWRGILPQNKSYLKSHPNLIDMILRGGFGL